MNMHLNACMDASTQRYWCVSQSGGRGRGGLKAWQHTAIRAGSFHQVWPFNKAGPWHLPPSPPRWTSASHSPRYCLRHTYTFGCSGNISSNLSVGLVSQGGGTVHLMPSFLLGTFTWAASKVPVSLDCLPREAARAAQR